jgi:hypothetical protein
MNFRMVSNMFQIIPIQVTRRAFVSLSDLFI